uniref:E3 ubiquitin-protein ligase RNF220 n=1 Tax=Esox lucius TaxID=8010 RepID=A0AAY5KHA0_ESOLU
MLLSVCFQDILVNLGGEEQDWAEQRRIHMTSILGGVKGPVLLSRVLKEGRDSDGDLDVDGDDTLEYGRAQYTEADIIPCSGHEPGELGDMEQLRGAVLNGGTLSNRGSALTTLDALKTQIRDLEKQLSRGDRNKCLICMDTYSTPLTSIQCWHVHCEECWLRSLGAKKLCPQCNTITSPGDLRRVFL